MVERKILGLDALARVAKSLKAKGRHTVLCHGVFDMMHIGHIRHFEAAKEFGDVLIVTITPDRFVNKGPGRPVFGEKLRAEAIAALGCVDYVAINYWPIAVRTIALLKPSFYAKGKEYENAAEDVTGKILDEERAVRKVGGRLVFTDEITFSSSRLINKHSEVLPEKTREFLANFTRRHRFADIRAVLEAAKSLRVLVVGEAIIDEYQYCTAIGKSSKEPTLVMKALSSEKFAGGILAVANHVAEFCSNVTMLTTLGIQNPQKRFIESHLKSNVQPLYIYRTDAPTIVKRRFIEHYFFMKMMEVYEINDTEPDEETDRALCGALAKCLPKHDLVIVVDYGHGMINREAITMLCRKSAFLALNTQSNAGNLGYHTVSMYPKADYVTMTEVELRLESRDRRSDVGGLVKNVAGRLDCGLLMATRGSHGCLGYDKKNGLVAVPAFAGKVVDRVGAGDAFLSISALCAVQGAPLDVLGLVGNCAGAQAVATVGNKESVNKVALLKQIETLMK